MTISCVAPSQPRATRLSGSRSHTRNWRPRFVRRSTLTDLSEPLLGLLEEYLGRNRFDHHIGHTRLGAALERFRIVAAGQCHRRLWMNAVLRERARDLETISVGQSQVEEQ